MRVTVFVAGVSLMLSGAGCAVRRVPTTFAEMEKHTPVGTTVYVTTKDGEEVTGTLATISASSISVALRDEPARVVVDANVASIRAKDPLWNGLVIGAGVGGFMIGALSDESCIAPYAAPDCKNVSRGAGILLGAGIGAALGAGFDALHHQRVFRSSPPAGRASVFVAPVVTPDTITVRIFSRF